MCRWWERKVERWTWRFTSRTLSGPSAKMTKVLICKMCCLYIFTVLYFNPQAASLPMSSNLWWPTSQERLVRRPPGGCSIFSPPRKGLNGYLHDLVLAVVAVVNVPYVLHKDRSDGIWRDRGHDRDGGQEQGRQDQLQRVQGDHHFPPSQIISNGWSSDLHCPPSPMGLVIIFLLLGDQLIIIGLLREIAINTVETSFKRLNLGDFSDGATRVYKCKY